MKHHRPRLLFLLAVLCLAVCLLAGCAARAATADPDADLPTIVIGSDSYPPFNYLSADGQPTGIDVELATEAFRRMGYKAQFVTIDWVDKKELVENGTVDCLWGSFSIDGREDEYRILDEPLQVVGLGVAFALNDDRGLDTALNAALADMRTDGTTRAILAKYLPDPDKYLEVDYGR